jgi:hypothetical protein
MAVNTLACGFVMGLVTFKAGDFLGTTNADRKMKKKD